jgi:hypothetical protein
MLIDQSSISHVLYHLIFSDRKPKRALFRIFVHIQRFSISPPYENTNPPDQFPLHVRMERTSPGSATQIHPSFRA